MFHDTLRQFGPDSRQLLELFCCRPVKADPGVPGREVRRLCRQGQHRCESGNGRPAEARPYLEDVIASDPASPMAGEARILLGET